MASEQDRKNVIDRIQREELAQLTKDLVDIPSPTGSEKAIGEFILSWYSRHGIKVLRQEISAERVNAVGILEGRSNGVSLTMLIDTGASTVVLKPADAQRLGIDVERLKYAVPVQTANGTTYAAHVRLRNRTLGPISLNDVEALVAKPGTLKENLLGMSFLSRLRSYEFTTDMLTLRS